MSAATTSYGVYALVEPRHLGRALTNNPKQQADYDVLARTYGARDLAVGAVGMLGSERAVKAAMLIRIAADVSDGLILSAKAKDDDTRSLILGVTFGWATLNALALVVDRRRAKRRPKLVQV
jgi:hypothetical protein